MEGMVIVAQKRGPRGVLKEAVREYLASLGGEPATIAQIAEAIKPEVGERPPSSYRSTLQDERYFERVERGVFRIKQD
ncbi:hypothetical protein [Gordonia sihwensis]|uniref:HTH HARE-type domain-containing protein n=1 Tax=Gordonia sihwensis NBRC 108236 TaxID=1223544 RepID=L7LNA9_9ACTN|nr:hypothetical protein [Gordonia sihwensis]GAC62379.1 hypothetical protein GSI01S_33_00650 [Gordonia sihwensis NBRC 108236]